MRLKDARQASLELYSQVQVGQSPGMAKRTSTFADLLAEYLHEQRHLVRIKERERELTKRICVLMSC